VVPRRPLLRPPAPHARRAPRRDDAVGGDHHPRPLGMIGPEVARHFLHGPTGSVASACAIAASATALRNRARCEGSGNFAASRSSARPMAFIPRAMAADTRICAFAAAISLAAADDMSPAPAMLPPIHASLLRTM